MKVTEHKNESKVKISMDIVYRELNKQDLHRELLKDFNRYQEVTSDWCRMQNG